MENKYGLGSAKVACENHDAKSKPLSGRVCFFAATTILLSALQWTIITVRSAANTRMIYQRAIQLGETLTIRQAESIVSFLRRRWAA